MSNWTGTFRGQFRRRYRYRKTNFRFVSPFLLANHLLFACSLWGFFGCNRAGAADFLSAGPLFQEFYLTLIPGHRIEALGPLFYREQSDTQKTWAVPPLFSD